MLPDKILMIAKTLPKEDADIMIDQWQYLFDNRERLGLKTPTFVKLSLFAKFISFLKRTYYYAKNNGEKHDKRRID